MTRTAQPRPLLLATVLACSLAACRGDGTGPTDPGRVIEGVDFDVLFADPDGAEIAAISAEWNARNPGSVDVVTEKDTVVTSGTLDVRVRVVSHDVEGVRHVGAIVAADGLPGPAPVIMYAHGGDQGTSVEELLFQFALVGELAAQAVWVIPSFRSEELSFAGTTWTSEGPPSPWDRDVDDALSLLDVALELEPAADEQSMGVVGFSRGAGVALLMGIRDARIDRIVEFFGPTDFFGPFVQDVVEEALRGTLRDLPGLEFLDQAFIQPLKNGGLTTAQVRPQLIRRSAVLFADRLPALQVHHGSLDTVVEVSQAESLIAAMVALGRMEPDFEGNLYPSGTHNPLTLPGSIPSAVDFLSQLLPATAASPRAPLAEKGPTP